MNYINKKLQEFFKINFEKWKIKIFIKVNI